nr:hypothetical protein [Heyndrickxia coagulans]
MPYKTASLIDSRFGIEKLSPFYIFILMEKYKQNTICRFFLARPQAWASGFFRDRFAFPFLFIPQHCQLILAWHLASFGLCASRFPVKFLFLPDYNFTTLVIYHFTKLKKYVKIMT